MFIMLYRSILKGNSFLRVLLSAFLFLFQNKVFKGLFRKYRHNVQIIPHYVRSDLGISHFQCYQHKTPACKELILNTDFGSV